MSKARALSHRLEAIEYIHAADGLPYRHDFSRDGSTIGLRADGSVVIRNKRAKLWDTFDVDGREQDFLVNPPIARGGRMAAKRRKMSAKQLKYFGPRRSRNKPAKARRRRRTVTRTRTVSAAPVRRRRRRRNPQGFSINSILHRVQSGALDATCIVVGKAGTRYIAQQFSYPSGSMMDGIIQGVSALGLGMLAERFIGSDRARFVLAGALSAPLETVIADANIPQISPLLGAVPSNTAAIYAAADRPRMGAWQQPRLAAWQSNDPSSSPQLNLPASQAILGS